MGTTLPTGYVVVGGYLLGDGSDFTGADLAGANFSSTTLSGVTWDNTTCPDGTNSDSDGGTCVSDLG